MSSERAGERAVPVTLIGGYLGAGKTTLINRLLSHPTLPMGTAVLVNDFGDINIDESLIRSESADGTVIGLSNGCICCSISNDLSKALDELNRLPIQHVILETSGVAEPVRVWQNCHYPGFQPKAAVVVVDAANFTNRAEDKYVGELVRAQVEQAHLLVISKTDVNPGFGIEQLTPQLSSRDPGLIKIVLGWRQTYGSVTPLASRSAQPSFHAETWHQQGLVSKESLQSCLAKLHYAVQRVKGWVSTDEGMYQVNRVARTTTLTRCQNVNPALLGLVMIYHLGAEETLEPFAQIGGFAPDQITMTLSS